MDINFLKLSPPSMIGWVDELDEGTPMAVEPGLGRLRFRVVISPKAVTIIALGDDPEASQKLLEQSCLRPDQVRRVLCG